VLDVSFGMGMLSLVFFGMAACHVLSLSGKGHGLPAYLAVLIGLIVGLPLIAGDAVPSLIDWLKQKRLPSWKTAVWVAIFVCLALAVLIPALAPPSGADWDSLAYHLAIPKLYLEHHGFYYIDFASHSNFPFLVEMLYTPALSLNDPAGAKMVHCLCGVLLVLAVVMLVRKHFTPKAAPLAALALGGMPIVLWEATTAYIDLAAALYTVLAVYFLLDYFHGSDRRALVGCAIAAGFAASTKMTGLALIVLLVVWLVMDRITRPYSHQAQPDPTTPPQPSPERGGGGLQAHFDPTTPPQPSPERGGGGLQAHFDPMTPPQPSPERGGGGLQAHFDPTTPPQPSPERGGSGLRIHLGRAVADALVLVGTALLVCSPWYLKTLIYTGNPVYPFFYSIFGGRDWTSELARNYAASQTEFGMGGGPANFLLLPYNLTLHWTAFCDRGQPWLIVGPILLVAVPLLLLARRKSTAGATDASGGFLTRSIEHKLIGLTLFFVAQLAIWFGLTQQSRYLIPGFAILAVIIAGTAYADERLRVTRIALHVTFAATALVGIWALAPFIRSAAPVVFGSETQSEYLSRTLPIYGAQEWINDNTPPDASIALFGDTRGFYLNRPYVWADWGHNRRFTRDFASVGDFVAYLKSQGVGYAMVNFGNLPDREHATGTYARVYQAIQTGRFVPEYVDEARGVGVYSIR